VTYFTNDAARELDGLRDGGPGWWLRGNGDASNPADVARVLATTDRAAIVGYDLIIAAPRPMSVLLAVDPEHARGVVDAHRASVRSTMEYLEERALVVRDRRGSLVRDEPAMWESMVSFTHGLNRHGEPHLHDHVLVGARPEGQRNVLDARGLYAHARAADALYRASLRHELAERTLWSAWRSFEGVERVVGLDEGYRALWAGHHRDRGTKLSWSRDEVLSSWARDRARFEPLGHVHAPERSNLLDEHRFSGAFEGRSDVSRRHVIEAWANAASYGQDPKEVVRSVDDLYPALRGRGGVHEPSISLREARMVPAVRTLGARPLDPDQLERWRERSLDRDRSRASRSR
jgi:hypothetical protein